MVEAGHLPPSGPGLAEKGSILLSEVPSKYGSELRFEVPGGDEESSLKTAETITCLSSPSELGIVHLPSPFRMLEQYPGTYNPDLFSGPRWLEGLTDQILD